MTPINPSRVKNSMHRQVLALVLECTEKPGGAGGGGGGGTARIISRGPGALQPGLQSRDINHMAAATEESPHNILQLIKDAFH